MHSKDSKKQWIQSALSFLLPISLLCILLYTKQIMPFGNISLLRESDPDKTLRVFYRFSHQLHNGTFSLLNPSGAYGMTMAEAFPFYLSSPFTLLAAMFPTNISLYVLFVFNILKIGFAGIAMYFLLFKCYPREKDSNTSPDNDINLSSLLPVVFSTAYALSSCFLVQQTDIRYLDHAFLFPLLFLSYKKFLSTQKSFSLYLMMTLTLLNNAPLALSALLILFIHLLSTDRSNFLPHTVLRFISHAALSVLSASITVFPCIHSVFAYGRTLKEWPDFSFQSDWLTFFSRFLPDSDASIRFMQNNGYNLYFGLFLLLIVFPAFLTAGQTRRQRIGRIVFALFLLFGLNTSTIFHIISFGTFENSILCGFDIVVVFFAILLAYSETDNLKSVPFIAYIASLLIPLALALFAGIHATHPVASTDLLPVLIFFTLYIAIFVLYRIGSIQKQHFLLIGSLLLLCELFINTEHQLYNLSKEQQKVTEQLSSLEKAVPISYDPFQVDSVRLDAPLSFRTDILPENYLLTGHYEAATRKPYDFETLNAIYASLGGEDSMFDIVNLPVTVTPRSAVVHQRTLKDNILLYESRNFIQDFHESTFSFNPPRSGQLYFSLAEISFLGEVTADEPAEIKVLLPKMMHFTNAMQVETAYFQKDNYANLIRSIQSNEPKVKKGLLSLNTQIDCDGDQTLVLALPKSFRKCIKVDGNRIAPTSAPAGQTAILLTDGEHKVTVSCFVLPIVGMLLITFFSVFCAVSTLLPKFKNSLETAIFSLSVRIVKLSDTAITFCHRYSISILSFLLPFSILLIACTLSSFAPFGNSVYFKTDGAALTVPNLYFIRNLMQNGNPGYSPITGGGTNAYYYNPVWLLNLWILLFHKGSLVVPATLLSILRIALCGPTLYLYLTKRLTGTRAYPKDPRILLFTTAYALSAYNLNFRYFINWPELVGILPLLLLAMDYLILRKKRSPYILLLAYCMITNTMNTIYLCIFLLCWFFLYSFDGVKDFFVKGLRFGLSSILSAGMSIWILAVNILLRADLGYNEADAILPNPLGFYQSYFTSLKQLFMLSEPVNITENDGAINLYCGVLCFLLLLFCLAFAKKNKRYFGRILIAAFILFSSNNDLLSYIWNGLHYQSKVPNRYSFLLIFLILDLAHDGLQAMRRVSRRKLLLTLSVAALLFALIISLAGVDIAFSSVVATTVFFIAYGILLYLIANRDPRRRKVLYLVMICVMLFELAANNSYTFMKEQYGDGTYIDENIELTNYLKDNWLHDDKQTRLSYLATEFINQHLVNDVSSINQFSSLTTSFQGSMASSYGFYNSPNNIACTTNETPFTNAMLNIGYMIVSPSVYNFYLDTDHYHLIGKYNDKLLIKNDRLLSLGFFVPDKFFTLAESTHSAAELANNFADAFTDGNHIYSDPLQLIMIDESEALNHGQPEGSCYIHNLNNGSTNPFMAHVKFTPSESGEYYYRNAEFYYLGSLEKDVEYNLEIPVRYENDPGLVMRYDDEAFQTFYDAASQNKLNISEFGNGYLTGTVNFPEDGQIMLSIPYENGWNATLDGKPVDLEHFRNGAIVIKGKKGKHTLEMQYTPPGKKITILITIPFWILFAILACLELRRPKHSLETVAEDIVP